MTRGTVLAVSTSTRLETEECISCGVMFAMTVALTEERRRDHANFYCPNGHGQRYTSESEAEKFKRLYESAEARAGRNYDRAEQTERSLRATRGVVTKLRRRAVAGACPFGCHRTFTNLSRHVATKHPDAKLEGETSGPVPSRPRPGQPERL